MLDDYEPLSKVDTRGFPPEYLGKLVKFKPVANIN
jgi:hypothetical protein